MGRRDDHGGWLVVIGLTGGGANDPERASLAALIAVEGAIFATGAALVRISTRRHVLPRAEGLLLGAAAGALFGVSDVAIKWLTQSGTRTATRAAQPVDAHRDDRRSNRLLRLRPQPPDRGASKSSRSPQ